MLARRAVFQLSRSAVASSSSRTFASSAISKRDFVQDLYLRELKSYKPKEVAANAHVGQVKEFHSPSPPQAPSVLSGADLAKELEAYEREDVPTSPKEAASPSASEDAAPGQTADEYISFVEQEARRQPSTEAHH